MPFFGISGSELVAMVVGVGAARVRDLFESARARARAPAILTARCRWTARTSPARYKS